MSSEIQSFRDLRVWQSGMAIVASVYRLTETFPKSEMYGLTSQLRRAAVSVPANIAEGHTREHTREYFQHVSIARGSLAEAKTHLEIAVMLGFVQREKTITAVFTNVVRELARRAQPWKGFVGVARHFNAGRGGRQRF